jgi:hypothetical protein
MPDEFERVQAALKNVKPLVVREAMAGPANIGDELLIEAIDQEVAKDRRFAFHVALNAPGIIEPEPALKTLHDMASLVESVPRDPCRWNQQRWCMPRWLSIESPLLAAGATEQERSELSRRA